MEEGAWNSSLQTPAPSIFLPRVHSLTNNSTFKSSQQGATCRFLFLSNFGPYPPLHVQHSLSCASSTCSKGQRGRTSQIDLEKIITQYLSHTSKEFTYRWTARSSPKCPTDLDIDHTPQTYRDSEKSLISLISVSLQPHISPTPLGRRFLLKFRGFDIHRWMRCWSTQFARSKRKHSYKEAKKSEEGFLFQMLGWGVGER